MTGVLRFFEGHHSLGPSNSKRLKRLAAEFNSSQLIKIALTLRLWRHKSKKSDVADKIWEWKLIFGHAVKEISSPGVRSP